MSANTPDQQITYPTGGDLADNPDAFINMLADAEQRLVRTYTTTADRTARMLVLAENEVSGLADTDRLEVYSGTRHVSLAARSHSSLLRRTTDAAAIVSSTALVSDATLVAPLLTNSTYMFDGVIWYASSTVADFKLAFTTPTFTVMRWTAFGLDVAAAGQFGDLKVAGANSSGSSASFGGAGAAVAIMLRFEGYISTTAAGNLQTQYAQANVDATNTTALTGSYLRTTLVA